MTSDLSSPMGRDRVGRVPRGGVGLVGLRPEPASQSRPAATITSRTLTINRGASS